MAPQDLKVGLGVITSELMTVMGVVRRHCFVKTAVTYTLLEFWIKGPFSCLYDLEI